jgi:hypothetical protein
VRGGVVSEHAARIIVQFMAACCGKSAKHDEISEEQMSGLKDLPDNAVPLARIHRLLDELSQKDKPEGVSSKQATVASEDPANGDEEDDAEAVQKKALHRSSQMQTALKVTADLWDRNSKPWPQIASRTGLPDWAPPRKPVNRKRKGATMTKKEAKNAAIAHQSRAYIKLRKADAKVWMDTLLASDERPTDEQRRFLERVIARCSEEHAELGKPRVPAAGKSINLSEPVRDCLFGIPGAGKSHCIKLLRRFFEDCLKWEDGVQFQFLAQQNTMASLIGGKTVNTWGVIPINPEAAARKNQAKNQDGDIDELFTNALGLRWLVIDECSTISPSLLGQLDAALRRACQRHPHARVDAHRRPFGGINIIFAGDLWQLPPVRAAALFSNPYRRGFSIEEQKIFKMFWQRQEDSIQRTFELTESKRTTDAWLKAVLKADRAGAETYEMYCFTHGLPTKNPGSWLPDTDKPSCGEPRCERLRDEWKEALFVSRSPWVDRVNYECETCKIERKRRCCIVSLSDDNKARLQKKPFTEAAYVHPFRYPSGHAQQLRAIDFAKARKQRLLWVTAHDVCRAKDDSKIQGERAEQQKEAWLQLPVGRTSGIPGLFPLVHDMPVRFTDAPDKEARLKGVFKNARGWLRGWELEAAEAERVGQLEDPEVVLQRRPKRLFIETESASKDLPLVNGKRIYVLTMRPKPWSLDGGGNVQIVRYGFPLVPDFGGTAHFYCGTSLDACIGDLLPWWRTPQREDALRSYIIKSRVKDGGNLLITQPYSPRLFRQGVLPGPHLLNETLMHRMTPEEAQTQWEKAEANAADKDGAEDTGTVHPLSKVEACCRKCSEDQGTEVWKPLSAFYTFNEYSSPAIVWAATLALGQDLVCSRCRRDRYKELMVCDKCNIHKENVSFTPEMQQAWVGQEDAYFCCARCRKDKTVLSAAEMHECERCMV